MTNQDPLATSGSSELALTTPLAARMAGCDCASAGTRSARQNRIAVFIGLNRPGYRSPGPHSPFRELWRVAPATALPISLRHFTVKGAAPEENRDSYFGLSGPMKCKPKRHPFRRV